MIRFERPALALFTLVALLGSGNCVAAEPSPITNGGFEQGDAEGVPADWETSGGKLTTEIVHSGESSLRIVHTGERKLSHFNRYWQPKSGNQGAMLPVLSGEISIWYQVVGATKANIWLGVIPMSADPWENTGSPRTGFTVPNAHVGDGQWHQAVVTYDYSASSAVKWVHVSCFIRGEAADVCIDDIEWARRGIGIASLDLVRDGEGNLSAKATVRNVGNITLPGAVAQIVLPDSLSLAPGETTAKTVFADLSYGEGGTRVLEWRLTGSPRENERLAAIVKTRGCIAAVDRALSATGCTGSLRPIPAAGVHPAAPRPVAVDKAPATPEWFKNVTRVAYSDLGNTWRGGDWPDKVIADLGKAGVQVFYSRAHSGDGWDGVGWRSSFSETALGKATPEGWAGVGISLAAEEAHSGKNSVRIEHGLGRRESYLIRRWTGRSGQQEALLDARKGTASFWYKVTHMKDASIWLGVLPMSAAPWEDTGLARVGITIPADHVGDGAWHQAKVPFDFSDKEKVKWIHVGCFMRGTEAGVLLDDIELLGVDPQPVTNGGFESQGRTGDRTRELADLCHKNGIRYLAYFLGMSEPADVSRDHPDWKCVGADGKPLARFCPNNPGYRQFMKDRFAEIITDCGVDGIFIDMHN
ncbi:MAG: hypothetical protein HN380_30295, partial [Victivallales bacterium]|nr:hypothetical protein [Victivallales bacterium]